MKNSRFLLQICLLVFFISLVTSSIGQPGSNTGSNNSDSQLIKNVNSQIGEYVIEIFEDSDGNLWFGTLGKGVAKYDGKSLKYYTTEDGLNGNRVGSIVEDSDGNLWFGTHSGISRYDGQTFINYTEKDGLCSNRVSNLLLDKTGNLWIGTWDGVCKFNGSNFLSFSIPTPDIELPSYQETTNWLTEISEDSNGNIWFAKDGYGAFKYDGITFTHFTESDGLASNNVQDIQEDKEGNIWFSSRVTEKDHPDPDKRNGAGGLVKYDGENFTGFPDIIGLNRDDVYQIYRDSKDNLWISTISNGVYKYNGNKFINYAVNYPGEGKSKAVVSILEDSKGSIWVGCAGGLFRLDSDGIKNITVNGPWN